MFRQVAYKMSWQMRKKSAYGYAYLIALLYVGFGTLAVLSMYPDDPFYGEWVLWGLFITFPVSAASWAVLYAAPSQLLLVVFIQFGIFVLTGKAIYRIFFARHVYSPPLPPETCMKNNAALLNKLKSWCCSILVLGYGGSVFFVIAMLGARTDNDEVRDIKKSGTSTVGTIIKVGGANRYAVAEYFVDGKRYERREGGATGVRLGQRCLVIYKSDAPWLSRVDYNEPVFINGK